MEAESEGEVDSEVKFAKKKKNIKVLNYVSQKLQFGKVGDTLCTFVIIFGESFSTSQFVKFSTVFQFLHCFCNYFNPVAHLSPLVLIIYKLDESLEK